MVDEPLMGPGSSETPPPEESRSGASELVASASLVLVNGATPGRVFPLTYGDSLIGRGVAAHIALDDKSVSLRHAKVLAKESGHVLVDLGSTNGTFLNGHRLPEGGSAELEEGDTVQLANAILVYVKGSADLRNEATQQLSHLAPNLSVPLLGPEPTLTARAVRTAEIEEEPPSLERLIDRAFLLMRFFRRHGLMIFAFSALCALLGLGSLAISRPLSEAEFTIALTPTVSQNPIEHSPEHQEGALQFFTSAERNFRTFKLVESTLQKTRGKKPTRREVVDVMSRLQFESIAQMTYRGTYSAPSAEEAVRFLEEHLKNYLETEIKKTLHVIQAEVDFLSTRLKEKDRELTETESKLRDFKTKNVDALPEYAQAHVTTREQLYSRRAEVVAQAERASLELASARKQVTEAAPMAGQRVAAAQPYETEIVAVERRLAEARARGLGETHADVIALKEQQRSLQRLAEQARAREVSELDKQADPGLTLLKRRVLDLQAAQGAAQAELNQVNGQLGRLEGIVEKMPGIEAKYAELTRSYAVNKEMHARLFSQLRSSQLQLELERASAAGHYEVLSPTESHGVPLRKVLLLRAGGAGFAGFILALGVALFVELRRFLRSVPRRRATQIALTAAQEARHALPPRRLE